MASRKRFDSRVYINKPGWLLRRCTIVGAAYFLWADLSGSIVEDGLAPRFEDCYFTDYPDYSEDGTVYTTPNFPMVGSTAAPRFIRCEFDYETLQPPTGSNKTVWEDCIIRVPVGTWQTQGQFYGKTEIFTTGGAALDLEINAPRFTGELFVNGVRQFYGVAAPFDPPSLAAGASTTTTVTVPGVRTFDQLIATFSLPLDGLEIVSVRRSAADTVEVVLHNDSSSTVDLASGTLTVEAR